MARSRPARCAATVRPKQRADCNRARTGTTCNLYMRHYNEQTEAWEPTKLVAVLSSEDAPDWGSNLAGDFAYMTARVSPDGNYLAFMSDRSLTGYDNEDVEQQEAG